MMASGRLSEHHQAKAPGRGRRPRRRPAPALGAEALESRQLMATFSVTSLDGAGPGSLHRAILDANLAPGADTIAFEVAGTIRATRPLPSITDPVTLDGTTAPGYAGSPVVAVDFRGSRGLHLARGADGSTVQGLSLVRAGNSGITLDASRVTVAGNFIGLLPDGSTPQGNRGDGVRINRGSRDNLIGHDDPVTGVSFADASGVPIQPVSAWQGIRESTDQPGEYLIVGTSGSEGLLYVGPVDGQGGESFAVNVPGAATSSVYGPDDLGDGNVRLVGSYRTGEDSVSGFLYEGAIADLDVPGNYRAIAYPGGQFTYVHSTMGGLAVGNSDGPTDSGLPIGAGRAFIYDVATGRFVADVVFPGSVSNTVYGIWHNGGTSYTLAGGFSQLPRSNPDGEGLPIGQGMLVDYDSLTRQFSNWKAFDYPSPPGSLEFVTHFEGISGAEKGVYTLNADSARLNGDSFETGSFVTVRRNTDGSFGEAAWVDIAYPGATGPTSSNSVAGNQVVGVAETASGVVSYQATVDVGFQLSNVISGNAGNGIGVVGSTGNRIAMNFIGTDAAGTSPIGNRLNGIRLTSGADFNRIGGQSTGGNDPTAGVFARPPQGNLISGNGRNGVLIDTRAERNVLSGNFIGTDAAGTAPIGNRLDGVALVDADNNQLLGCTFQQDPFVFYNVLSGNGGNGLRVTNSDNTTVHANFMGAGADNATVVPNGGDGLLISGNSDNTQVGGVIPLGNVISGNGRHGIEVRDTASNFISFNTFAGLFAFAGPAPNRLNGITITSGGGNNLVRTSIVSGNLGHGIEIGGHARGVQVTDTGIGTTTNLQAAMPNGGSGVYFSGRARGNVIGGFQPSIEPTNTLSANRRYGVEFAGQARDNAVVHSYIGTSGLGQLPLGNALGGVALGPNTRSNRVGGADSSLENTIAHNGGPGVLLDGATDSDVLGNDIRDNAGDGVLIRSARRNRIGTPLAGNAIVRNGLFGVRALGPSGGTVIQDNRIADNGSGDVDLDGSRGVTYIPG